MKVKGWDDGCLFTGGAAASGTHQQQLAAPPQPSAVLKPIIAKLRGSCQTNTPHTKACKDSGPILELLTQEFHWSGIWVHTQHQENSAAASIKALALTECLLEVSLLKHHLRTSPCPPRPERTQVGHTTHPGSAPAPKSASSCQGNPAEAPNPPCNKTIPSHTALMNQSSSGLSACPAQGQRCVCSGICCPGSQGCSTHPAWH